MKSFKQFLKDKDCSIGELTDYISTIIDIKKDIVYIYSSHMDNLGNSESDIDVYVFLANSIKVDYFHIENHNVSNINLDIEYRSIKFLETIVNKYKHTVNDPTKINVFDLKLIQRIKAGLKLDSGALLDEIEAIKSMNTLDITHCVSNYYCYLARSEYDDGVRMFAAGNFIASRECLRKGVIYQAGAVNSIYGEVNLKEKWISTIFLKLDRIENKDIVTLYWKSLIYEKVTSDNIEDVCKNLINLYQMLVSEVAFNS